MLFARAYPYHHHQPQRSHACRFSASEPLNLWMASHSPLRTALRATTRCGWAMITSRLQILDFTLHAPETGLQPQSVAPVLPAIPKSLGMLIPLAMDTLFRQRPQQYPLCGTAPTGRGSVVRRSGGSSREGPAALRANDSLTLCLCDIYHASSHGLVPSRQQIATRPRTVQELASRYRLRCLSDEPT